MATQAAVTSETGKVHRIHVTLPDEVLERIEPNGDRVELHLHSKAIGRHPAPIVLSYTTLMRLTRDDS